MVAIYGLNRLEFIKVIYQQYFLYRQKYSLYNFNDLLPTYLLVYYFMVNYSTSLFHSLITNGLADLHLSRFSIFAPIALCLSRSRYPPAS